MPTPDDEGVGRSLWDDGTPMRAVLGMPISANARLGFWEVIPLWPRDLNSTLT